jgi:8-oxo-dGTP pyrophosphatase MutT (NUDIX family)
VAHCRVPVKPPVRPVQAATLVLVRDRPAGGFELLLIKRHTKSKFAAGDYVFPGGKVEAADGDAARWCSGAPASDTERSVDLEPAGAIAHRVAVVRETFEEVGVLLARDSDRQPARLAPSALEKHRLACHAGRGAFWDMLDTERLTIPTDRLIYFAHWITPEESPLRFDTRFFVVEMPAGQAATADDHEIVDVRWLSPAEALQANARGEISLRNATKRNVELFATVSSVAEMLAKLSARTFTTIRPRIVTENGVNRTLMPGDPGYW